MLTSQASHYCLTFRRASFSPCSASSTSRIARTWRFATTCWTTMASCLPYGRPGWRSFLTASSSLYFPFCSRSAYFLSASCSESCIMPAFCLISVFAGFALLWHCCLCCFDCVHVSGAQNGVVSALFRAWCFPFYSRSVHCLCLFCCRPSLCLAVCLLVLVSFFASLCDLLPMLLSFVSTLRMEKFPHCFEQLVFAVLFEVSL